jgi:putative flippase GtrA
MMPSHAPGSPKFKEPAKTPSGASTPVGGFVLAGSMAFLVDSAVLMALTRVVGLPVLGARLLAIATAMVVSWLINRSITFPVRARPGLAEFARFAAVAWSAAVMNYAVFAVLVFLIPALHPVAAIGIASLCAMTLSYIGMKFGVFDRSR